MQNQLKLGSVYVIVLAICCGWGNFFKLNEYYFSILFILSAVAMIVALVLCARSEKRLFTSAVALILFILLNFHGVMWAFAFLIWTTRGFAP
jgi:hypothetical protein